MQFGNFILQIAKNFYPFFILFNKHKKHKHKHKHSENRNRLLVIWDTFCLYTPKQNVSYIRLLIFFHTVSVDKINDAIIFFYPYSQSGCCWTNFPTIPEYHAFFYWFGLQLRLINSLVKNLEKFDKKHIENTGIYWTHLLCLTMCVWQLKKKDAKI